MQLKFDPNQDFQLDAINAVADLFEGQRKVDRDIQFKLGGIPAVPNRLDLTPAHLLTNLQAVQKRNFDPQHTDPGYHGDPQLLTLTAPITTAAGPTDVSFPNYSVEMETGTGKTYVYLRTALELHRRFGMRKYIIVVPSIAIREGVLKTLHITQSHFQQLFDNTPYRFYPYDSKDIVKVRQFALSDSVEFMVMTLAAFNKTDINVIHQTTDRLQGETPIFLLQAARPILILDEPQNMESERSIASLATLNPLFALRYSATHRNPYNMVYRLSPAEAYRRRLVKRIEVASTTQEGDTLKPYIRLISTKAQKRTLTARIAIHKLMKTGQIRESTLTVKPGDSLVDASGGRDIYHGYDIAEIDDGIGIVKFANTETVRVGDEIGDEKAAVFQAQIHYTIEQHFQRQAVLKPLGIKVLTLFFIDRVDNYAGPEPVIRRLFDQTFNQLKQTQPDWRHHTPDQVQAAYFAQRTTRAGDIIFEDTKTGQSARDREAFALIMQDKERLLSFDEPTAFIFSHSALREGWDNPNVFQICTLNQSVSDVRKRQEIGRGVRLAVDQNGERLTDDNINVLTVVANESYETFVAQLQSELQEEVYAEIAARFGKPYHKLSPEEQQRVRRQYNDMEFPPAPGNARRRVTITLDPTRPQTADFQQLWQRISHKIRYSVHIDTPKLIDDVIAELQHVRVQIPRVAITKAKVDINADGAFQAWQMSAARTLVGLNGRYPLPNMVDLIANLLEYTTPPMRLTRRTILAILQRTPNLQQAIDNPNDYAAAAADIIKNKLAEQLIRGIRYETIQDWYHASQFEPTVETWDNLIEAAGDKSLYDHIIVDSQVERDFVQQLRHRDDIHMFIKLPNWFKVPTPIGNYNPDWAIVMDDPRRPGSQRIYFITETKGTTDRSRLQWTHERRKIDCAERAFQDTLNTPYIVAKTVTDIDTELMKQP